MLGFEEAGDTEKSAAEYESSICVEGEYWSADVAVDRWVCFSIDRVVV